MTIDAILFNDPGCPWGYSASPDFAVLRWRYGDRLRWRLVMIGLAGDGRDRRRGDRGGLPARPGGGTPCRRDTHRGPGKGLHERRFRYTAPSVVLSNGNGAMVEAGGFQSIEAYDVCLANLDPSLRRRPPPDDPHDALTAFDHGLTTQEVAAILAQPLIDPDRSVTEARLLESVGEGRAERTPLGDDALWHAAG